LEFRPSELAITFRQLDDVAVLAAEMFDKAQKYDKKPKVQYKHQTRHLAKRLLCVRFLFIFL
jgi:hypothetical protein